MSYGVNRAVNGLTAGGLDYLGNKFGFDSRMNNYLNLLSPQERKQRENKGEVIIVATPINGKKTISTMYLLDR